jgi:hypothetical protein
LHDIVQILLHAGADPLKEDYLGRTSLHIAAEGHRTRTIEQILAGQSQTEIRILISKHTKSGKTPLDLAIAGLKRESTPREACSLLLEAGADPSSSLHLATAAGTWLVSYLLRYKPILNHYHLVDDTLQTPLTFAVSKGRVSIVSLLLDAGADCNVPDSSGYTALHYAATTQNQKILDILLINNASIAARNNKGESPLDLALQSGITGDKRLAVRLAFQLLEAGAQVPRPKATGARWLPCWPAWTQTHEREFLNAFIHLPKLSGDKCQKTKYSPSDTQIFLNGLFRKGINTAVFESEALNSLQIWAVLPDVANLTWWVGSPEMTAITNATTCLIYCGASVL